MPMPRNAAAGFVLCGVALLSIVAGGPCWLVAGGAGVIAALGFVTLAEFVFGVNLGVDQMLGPSYIPTPLSPPGRMSQAGAVCFILCSVALLTAHWGWCHTTGRYEVLGGW